MTARADLIVIDGVEHDAAELEATVERSHVRVLAGRVATFSVDEMDRSRLVVVLEAERRSLPAEGEEAQGDRAAGTGAPANLNEVITAVCAGVAEAHAVNVHAVVLVTPGSLPVDADGAVKRSKCSSRYADGKLKAVSEWQRPLVPLPRREEVTVAMLQTILTPYVQAKVAKVLGRDVADLQLDQPLMESGLTSMLAVVLDVELQHLIGTDLAAGFFMPATVVFNYPRVDQLAQYLAQQLLQIPSWPAHIIDESPDTPVVVPVEQVAAEPEPVAAAQAEREPIAVVGLGCRFPGDVHAPDDFWRLLVDGDRGIRTIPPTRWDVEGLYDPDPDAQGKIYARFGGFIDGVDQFDSDFFGIAPSEAEQIDPQQRLLLEVSWEALEHAAIPPDQLAKTRCGVFFGLSYIDYQKLVPYSLMLERVTPHTLTGNAANIASGRLSYLLGLEGPSMTIDTACSSSLLAVHLACQSLRAGDCNTALVGGASLMLAPEVTVSLCNMRALSPGSACRAFDAGADGFIRGEGCGVVVLKRLSDAVRDQNRILALIRGSAVSQDGRSSMLTAPNGLAQEDVIRRAVASGEVAPGQVQVIETHGTGTPLGDPIELGAIGAALSEGRDDTQRLAIGAVKTNVGHLEPAAGVTGLTKLVLSLVNEAIPPHPNLDEVNPQIPLERIPVAIPGVATPWPRGEQERLGGVSAFGFSGTNVHVLVGEAPAENDNAAERAAPVVEAERPMHVLAVSAKSDAALQAQLSRYADHLEARPHAAPADVCYTANAGRSHFTHRAAVTGATTEQLVEGLRAASNGAGAMARVAVGKTQPKIAFLFTGQGAQYIGMGRELYRTQPTFRATLDRCAKILDELLPRPLLDVLFDGKQEEIDQTQFAQPALFAIEYAMSELWQSWGVRPTAVIGHSVGELVAACVAGVFGLEDGLRLIAARGRLMQALPAGGKMVALFADEDRVREAAEPHSDKVSVAVVNGPGQIVLSGAGDAIDEIASRFEADGVRTQRLSVSHAFHSPLMDPMLEEFEQVASQVEFTVPKLMLISNLRGDIAERRSRERRQRPPTAPQPPVGNRRAGRERRKRKASFIDVSLADYWVKHVRDTVRFGQGLETLERQGIGVFLEVGPKPVLLGIGRNCLPDNTGTWVSSLNQDEDDWEQVSKATAELYTGGVTMDWGGFDRDYQRRIVDLPTYAFQRRRRWLDAGGVTTATQDGGFPLIHPFLGRHLVDSTLHVFEGRWRPSNPPWIQDHFVHEMLVVPGAAYLDLILDAAAEALGPGVVTLEDVMFSEPLFFLTVDDVQTVQVTFTPDPSGKMKFTITSHAETNGAGAPWILHASGEVGVQALDAPEGARAELESLKARCTEEISGAEVYQLLRDHALSYGDAFERIQTLWKGDGEWLGLIEKPKGDPSEVDFYHIHPGVMDSCFQQVIASVPEAALEAAGSNPFIPLGADNLRLFERPGERLWCHSKLRRQDAGEAEAFTADLRIFSEAGDPVATVTGLHVKRARVETWKRIAYRALDSWCYDVRWDKAEPLRPAADVTGDWLVLADRGGVGEALAGRLEKLGGSCELVYVGGEASEGRRTVNAEDPSALAELLEELERPWRGVVHLLALDGAPGDETTLQTLDAEQRVVLGSSLELVRNLARSGDEPPQLWFVTRGAQGPLASPEEGGSPKASVAQASVWGLGRVVEHEHPELRCRRIDLDPGGGEALDALVAHVSAPDREEEVALRGEDRFVRRVVPWSAPAGASEVMAKIEADATYLISGGLGGLGLVVASRLVERGARHLVLMGRSKPRPAAVEAIKAMEQLGATVTAFQGDISVEDDVARAVKQAADSMPPLRGVLHLAGVLDDGMLADQTWERFEKVLAPKVRGGWNLHHQTKDSPLDFFVLFSSQASVTGNPGQGNYAAANAVLDALASYRRSLGMPAFAVNWGPWGEVGMATGVGQLERRRWKRLGMEAIPPEKGMMTLELEFGGADQAMVMPVEWGKFLTQYADVPASYSELARDQVTEGAADEAAAGSGLLQQLEATPAAERREALIAFVREQVLAVLGRDASFELDPQSRLMDVGVDSLMAVNLRNVLRKALGRPLPATLMFDYPSVEAIADYLLTKVLKLETPEAAAAAEEPAESEEDNLVSEIDDIEQLIGKLVDDDE